MRSGGQWAAFLGPREFKPSESMFGKVYQKMHEAYVNSQQSATPTLASPDSIQSTYEVRGRDGWVLVNTLGPNSTVSRFERTVTTVDGDYTVSVTRAEVLGFIPPSGSHADGFSYSIALYKGGHEEGETPWVQVDEFEDSTGALVSDQSNRLAMHTLRAVIQAAAGLTIDFKLWELAFEYEFFESKKLVTQ